MDRLRALVLPTALVLLLVGWSAGAISAEEATEPSKVQLEGLVVEPADPAPDTLCRLHVAIRNDGTQVASQLGFSVTINGTELPVYRNQLFMYPVGPGETTDIPLYNFWSTETSRPAPADGKLDIRVELTEAQWMKIEMEDDVEVWTPQGAIDGLPVAAQRTLTMSSP